MKPEQRIRKMQNALRKVIERYANVRRVPPVNPNGFNQAEYLASLELDEQYLRREIDFLISRN